MYALPFSCVYNVMLLCLVHVFARICAGKQFVIAIIMWICLLKLLFTVACPYFQYITPRVGLLILKIRKEKKEKLKRRAARGQL